MERRGIDQKLANKDVELATVFARANTATEGPNEGEDQKPKERLRYNKI